MKHFIHLQGHTNLYCGFSKQGKYYKHNNESYNQFSIDTPNKYEVSSKSSTEMNTELDLAKQQRQVELEVVEEETKNNTDDLAESSDREYSDLMTYLPQQLQDIHKQLKFTARRGKTKEIRKIAREYRREFVKDMKYTCKTLGIYFRKVRNGNIGENMITPEQMTILNAKTQARHEKIKGFVGDTLTGDNMFAERGSKKDVFVGPDMKTSTDGVEVRGTCTAEQANAMGNACSQPQTAEWKKKYYGMIDKNINVPIFGNTGNQVVKTSLKLLPDIVRLGVGIKYGIDTIKGIFGLFSEEGRKPEALWKLTKSAGILGLVAFTDVDKAVDYVGGRFSNASKTYSNNGTSNIGSNAEIISGLSNLKAGESLPFGYGETLMGKAFAVPGVTIGEINQEKIIAYNGNRPIGIDFSRLKKLYSEKINGNNADIPKYTQAIANVNDLEIAYGKLKTKEQKEEFMDTMTKVGISKEILENQNIQDKPIALFMASAMKTAEILPELGQRLVLTDKIMSNKDVETYISTYGKEKFMDDIMKLPDNIRLGIEEGKVTFEMKDGKLAIQSSNQESFVDINKQTISNFNRSGQLVDLPFALTNISETIALGVEQNKMKNTFQNTSLYPKSFFLDKSGNDMEFMKGPRDRSDPTSRRFGQKETALAGGLGSGLSKTMPKINDNMKLFIDYENSLDLWMTDTVHEKHTQLVNLIKIHLPTIKEGTPEYDAIMLSLLHLSTMPTASDITGMVKEGKDLRVTFKDGSKKSFSELVGGMNITERRNSNHKAASIGSAIGSVIYGTGEGIVNLWKGFYNASGIKTGVNIVSEKISNTRDNIFDNKVKVTLTKTEQTEYENLIKKGSLTTTEQKRLNDLSEKIGEPHREDEKVILSKLSKNKYLKPNQVTIINDIIKNKGNKALSDAQKAEAIKIIESTLDLPNLSSADKQELEDLLIQIKGKSEFRKNIENITAKMNKAVKDGGEWFVDPDTGEWRLKKAGGQIVGRSAWLVGEGLEKAAYGLGRFMVGIKTAVLHKIKGLAYGIVGKRSDEQRLEHRQESMMTPELAIKKTFDNDLNGAELHKGDHAIALQKAQDYQNKRKIYEDKAATKVRSALEEGGTDMDIAKEIFDTLEENENEDKRQGDRDAFIERIKYVGVMRAAREGKIDTPDIKVNNQTITDNKEKLRTLFPQKVDSIVMGCYFFARNRLFDSKVIKINGEIQIGTWLGNESNIDTGAQEVYKQITGKEFKLSTTNVAKQTIADKDLIVKINAIKSIITYIQKNVK